MPNWCFNALTATGPAGAVGQLVGRVTGRPVGTDGRVAPFDLDAAVPAPPAAAGAPASWRLYWWATRSAPPGPPGTAGTLPDGRVSVAWDLDTAYSPPVHAVAQLALRQPEVRLHLSYEEPGNLVYGSCTFQDGRLVTSTTGEHDDLEDDVEYTDDDLESPRRDLVDRLTTAGPPAGWLLDWVRDTPARDQLACLDLLPLDALTSRQAVRLAAEATTRLCAFPLLPLLRRDLRQDVREAAGALYQLAPLVEQQAHAATFAPAGAQAILASIGRPISRSDLDCGALADLLLAEHGARTLAALAEPGQDPTELVDATRRLLA